MHAVYGDRISGAKERRPGLDKMMTDARGGEFDVIVVWRFYRFVRSVLQFANALEEFRELGIDFVSHQEAVDTSTPMGKVTFRVIVAMAELERQKPIATGSGRLELAGWLSSAENSLTARVIVNRIWQCDFRDGIGRSANKWGRMDEPPTHPELLDYQAAHFVESGSSVKAIHRLLALSDLYCSDTRLWVGRWTRSGRSLRGGGYRLSRSGTGHWRWTGRSTRRIGADVANGR